MAPLIQSKGIRRVLYAGAVIAALILAGSLVFHFVEGLRWLDAFYYATMIIMTIATITPVHDATKLFLMGYALVGVASVLYLVTGVASYYLEQRESTFERKLEKISEIVQNPYETTAGRVPQLLQDQLRATQTKTRTLFGKDKQ